MNFVYQHAVQLLASAFIGVAMKHVLEYGYYPQLAVENVALSDVVVVGRPLGEWAAISAFLMAPFVCAGIVYSGGLRGQQRDQMLAAVETIVLAIGVLLSGPPFLVGALVLREMRGNRHWRAVILVAILAAYQACPDFGVFLPKKKELGWFESLFTAVV